ncbi:LLM class flavin-dependent oxidoreductase [Methylobacterium sp. J-048]|uniref:LLM class flavin-dependent oxidoreductase n=1 Tax=Methylobacterium sp. J-048 TaxID=2836635 RepID=UPI001FB934A7|nr:LLM class flavin-dependent oxidoreductase [Methylobacterium sp. J-048]MCJ2058741.1 LLM class flavin-dependent oxidoreductase [Methylobacterium sp. J-048]
MSRRHLHLNVNILHAGFFASAWRLPDSRPSAFTEIAHYVRTAQIAERGKLDAVFLADTPSLAERPDLRSFLSLEPTIVLASIAAATERIGLIATASTTYNEPYNVARRFATLDHASGGRAGWNVVTTADAQASANFGLEAVPDHATRYARAQEFTEIVRLLWDSWDDDALVGDKAAARLIDPARLHAIDYHGRHLSVAGPLNLPRSPQGRPVLVQAGGSEDGRDLAARFAEVVFSVGQTPEESRAYADDLRRRAARYGRGPDTLVVLPGLATVIGSTEAEAKRRREELTELIPIAYGLSRLGATLGVDLTRYDLDAPLPEIAIPANGSTTFAQAILAHARRDGLTLRQLIGSLGGGTGHRIVVGTPEQIADDIEHWFRAGAADGFNLMPDVLPTGLETFVDTVVPIPQQRGLFRRAYDGVTLRDHLGLDRPANHFAARTPHRLSA